MPRNVVGTVVKILAASLVVGLVLAALDITPQQVLEGLGETARSTIETGAGLFAWALDYILIGAAVVVPIWLVILVVRRARR